MERIVKTIRFPKKLIEEVNVVSSWKNMNFTDFVTDAYEIKNLYKGYKLELYDCIIAATAINGDLILVTKSSKHYPDKRIKLFIPEY